MPIYEYVCEQCGQKFETLRSIKESDQEIACTACNSFSTRRMISSCYAHSSARVGSMSTFTDSSSGGCGGCSGGSCSSCNH